MLKCIGASALLSVVTYLVWKAASGSDTSGFFDSLVALITGLVSGAVVFSVAAWLLRIDEATQIFSAVLRRVRRS